MSAATASGSSTPTAAPGSSPSRRPSMRKLIEWRGGRAADAADAFAFVADDEDMPAGDVIVTLARFHAEGERLIGEGPPNEKRRVGVRVAAGEDVESLAYDL